MTPTTPAPPPPVVEADESSTPARFTRAANYLALCGTAIPNGRTSSGLPTSAQIMCRGGHETLSLRIAAAYERARGPMTAPALSTT